MNVKYEGLILHTAATINRISDFVGIGLDLAEVEEPSTSRLSTLGANSPFSMKVKGVSKEALGRHRMVLRNIESLALTNIVQKSLDNYGYDTTDKVDKKVDNWICESSILFYINAYSMAKRFIVKHGFGRWSSSTLEIEDDEISAISWVWWSGVCLWATLRIREFS